MEAHESYRAGNIDTALLKYAMLAELGYEVAQSNVAYILDHGKLLPSLNRLACNCAFKNPSQAESTRLMMTLL